MKATVLREFRGAPDGEKHARKFVVGDEITGNFAADMVAAGLAQQEGGPARPNSNKSAKPDRNR